MQTLIAKDLARFRRQPNLIDYAATRTAFDWATARSLLDGLPGGRGLNIAHEAVDRHATGPRAARVALRWLGKDGERREFTYRQLAAETNRFANALGGLGLGQGGSVFVLLGRVPELYIAMLGALKARCVASPLFSAFGPEPIATRLQIGDGQVLVTTEALYRRKVAALRGQLSKLAHVILIDDGPPVAGTVRWRELMATAGDDFTIPPTSPDDMALLHFTSGTTGRPKGAIHVHDAVVTHHATGFYALDLHDDDVFWCTADPGWVTGTSYGIIAPLTHGVTNLVVEAEFDAQNWYGILAQERVTVWYTAPTAIRMMMKLGTGCGARLRPLSAALHGERRRAAQSGGGAVGRRGVRPAVPRQLVADRNGWHHDRQLRWRMQVKPGSMGQPLPGIEAAIVERNPDGSVTEITCADGRGRAGAQGRLAVDDARLSARGRALRQMLRRRVVSDRRSREARQRRLFLVRRPRRRRHQIVRPSDRTVRGRKRADGASGRGRGRRDRQARPDRGRDRQGVRRAEAWFCADRGVAPELLGPRAQAARRGGGAEGDRLPRNLPKTRSGKIMRRLLKARELGLPEGDLSTLESDER